MCWEDIRISVTLLIFRPLIALIEKKKKKGIISIRMLCLITSSNFLPSLGKLWRHISHNVLGIYHSFWDAPVGKKGHILLFISGNYLFICAEPFSFPQKINLFYIKVDLLPVLAYAFAYNKYLLHFTSRIYIYIYICMRVYVYMNYIMNSFWRTTVKEFEEVAGKY